MEKSDLNCRDRYKATESIDSEPTKLSDTTVNLIVIVCGFVSGLALIGGLYLYFK